MAEPSNAKTMSDLILRVAEKLGIADYRSTGQLHIPVSQYNFNLCKRYVQNGITMFMADAPKKGWRWMRRLCTVTFDEDGTGNDNISSDAARYMLPENFGGTVDGKIEYDADTSVGTNIEWCDEATIRARRSLSVNSGIPTLAAIRPYQPTSETLTSTRRWEMIVDPQPGSAYVVKFPYTLHFDNMNMESGIATGGSATTLADSARSEADDYFNAWIITVIDGTGVGETATVTDYTGSSGTFTFTALSGGSTPDTTTEYIVQPATNLHPAGHQFDDAIEAACLARTEMESQDEHFDTFWTDYYHKKALLKAYEIDQRSVPRTLGPMLGGTTIKRTRLGDSAGFTYLDSDGASVVQS